MQQTVKDILRQITSFRAHNPARPPSTDDLWELIGGIETMCKPAHEAAEDEVCLECGEGREDDSHVCENTRWRSAAQKEGG